jgi:hypothetical protein
MLSFSKKISAKPETISFFLYLASPIVEKNRTSLQRLRRLNDTTIRYQGAQAREQDHRSGNR